MVAGRKIGNFALVRTVATSAMGELHLASDHATGLPVAIKTVRFQGSELTRERFLRESEAAARLNHPDIVRTYAAGIDDAGDSLMGWIAMEWVSGTDLTAHITKATRLPDDLVLAIMARRHGENHRLWLRAPDRWSTQPQRPDRWHARLYGPGTAVWRND